LRQEEIIEAIEVIGLNPASLNDEFGRFPQTATDSGLYFFDSPG